MAAVIFKTMIYLCYHVNLIKLVTNVIHFQFYVRKLFNEKETKNEMTF